MKLTHELPRLGMRTIKTAICVCVCLLIDILITNQISLYSSIVAIVCMQSTIENTLKTSVSRIVGTAIGGGFGILMLWLTNFYDLKYSYLIFIPLGIIISIYLCNLIKMPGSSVICAIVFITVTASPVMSYSGFISNSPYTVALYRITDTLIGIAVATLVNRFIKPPRLYEERRLHLVCNTYENVYERVKDQLDGIEQLILYDTHLTEPSFHRAAHSLPSDCGYSVHIPVPAEIAESDSETIATAYITDDFKVKKMNLPLKDGYVQIPCDTFPCTIVWQSEQPPNKISLLN